MRTARHGGRRRLRDISVWHATIWPVPNSRPAPLVVAHRGSSATYAEMTLGAYRAALAEGADGLECDLRLTVDWHLVAVHDRVVDRTANGTGSVSAMSLAQLRALDYGAWKYAAPGVSPEVAALAADPENSALTTLADLIGLAVDSGREVALVLETKHPTRFVGAVERAVAELLDEHDIGGRPGTGRPWATVMSFSTLAVRRFARLRPDIPVVQLVDAGAPYRYVLSTTDAKAAAGLDIAILRSSPEIVAEQRALGRRVYVWTVDADADVALCLDLGVDAIITNRPGPVRELVRAHVGAA